MAKYQNIEEIGDGSFGKVYQVVEIATNKIFALKKIKLKDLSNEDRLECENEAKMMQDLSHPNVIHFHDHFVHNDKLYIVMTCCDGGDLASLIEEQRMTGTNFTELQIMHFFVQMVLGLNYMHSNDVLHRDIKPGNTFVLGNRRVVLGDLGFSKVLDGTIKVAHSKVGTPLYMAPEIYKNEPYGPKVDIWAIGCILFELVELNFAFNAGNEAAVMFKVLSGALPEINGDWSDDLKNLVRIMLSQDASERPSTDDLLQMDFVKQHIVSFIRNLDNDDEEEGNFLATQMIKDAVLAACVDLGMVNAGRHKHAIALANQFRDLNIRALLNGDSETKKSTEEVSVVEAERSPSNNFVEAPESKNESVSVPEPSSSSSNNVPAAVGIKSDIRDSNIPSSVSGNSDSVISQDASSSNTEDFGSEFENWNNRLMTINEIDDEEEMVNAQYELLESIIYSSRNNLTKSELQALVERCSQESLHRCDKCGYTPLHNAAKYGEVDSIRALLDGVDFDYRNVANNWFGDTPLHDAASSGKVDSIRALLDGADPDYRNVTNKYGHTPLHEAARNQRVDCIRALLDGADPDYRNVTNEDGCTPLHTAAFNGHVDTIRALLDGADPDYRNVTDEFGKTALFIAEEIGYDEAVQLLK